MRWVDVPGFILGVMADITLSIVDEIKKVVTR